MLTNVIKVVQNIILSFLVVITAGCLFLFVNSCNAQAGSIELQSVTLNYINYFKDGVDPLLSQNGLPNKSPGQHLSLGINTNLFSYIYWDSLVHSGTDRNLNEDGSTTPGQFRVVGLIMRLGISLTDQIQIGLFHHSQHLLDTTYAHGPWPRVDGLELRINLYQSRYSRPALF